jgi:hydrogenase maturation protein HypF
VIARRAIAVTGVVQGVGFRPFVFGLASRFGLGGFVRNETSGVAIEIEGDDRALDAFVESLRRSPPAGARIEGLSAAAVALRAERDFRIEASRSSEGVPVVAPDTATCDACVEELFDPSGRRHRYPFINCASCGPRLTIVTRAPYDRASTTMAAFAMCTACRAEHDDPIDRRFHAQPIACPACGPTLVFERRGARRVGEDAISAIREALASGAIGAIKGLGGYHIACDATRADVVQELRRRKARDDKPFAVMVRDIHHAEDVCALSDEERALLASPSRPIVIVRRRGEKIARSVSPDTDTLGVMLPYTPLHHLLLEGGAALVMTSCNASDEPIAYTDDAARAFEARVVDFVVTHDRAIRTRCDDSVARVIGGAATPIRRARGEAPRPLQLPAPLAKATLAVGGDLKSAFALGAGDRATMAHHLGDLVHLEAARAFERAISEYAALFRCEPQRVVCDLHPDYISSRFAASLGLEIVRVQHHRAHVASCAADAALPIDAQIVGVAFDGTGFGDDGTMWGGEFFVGTTSDLRRAAWLTPVALPGGDGASREPWRMAVAHLVAAGLPPHVPNASRGDVAVIEKMIERGVNAPRTSSVGRLFDAVAALVGVEGSSTYEGRAAVRLEALAASTPECGRWDVATMDAGAFVRAVAGEIHAGVDARVVARRFHATLAHAVAKTCTRIADGARDVVLSGGVFVNAVLAIECEELLRAEGFRVHRHRQVPPNDGGLALGQLAICAAFDRKGAA